MNKNEGKILLGLTLGALAGAFAGILFAPDKGENTRKKLLDKSNEFAEDLDKNIQEGLGKVNSLAESAFNLINKYKDQFKEETAQAEKNMFED